MWRVRGGGGATRHIYKTPTRKVMMMYMSPRTKMTAGKTSVEALVDVMSVDGGPMFLLMAMLDMAINA